MNEKMSELLNLLEKLPDDKLSEVMDFALFLMSRDRGARHRDEPSSEAVAIPPGEAPLGKREAGATQEGEVAQPVETPPQSREEVLISRLADLTRCVDEGRFLVDQKQLKFARRAPEAATKLLSGGKDRALFEKLLVECVVSLGDFVFSWSLPGYEDVAKVAGDIESEFSEYLSGQGYLVFPSPAHSTSVQAPGTAEGGCATLIAEAKAAVGDVPEAYIEKPVFSSLPPGSIVATVRPGVLLLLERQSAAKRLARRSVGEGGSFDLESGPAQAPEVIHKAEVLVSTGESQELAAILSDCLHTASRHYSRSTHSPALKVMKNLREWFENLAGYPRENDPVLARYAVNALHEANSEGKLDAPIRKLIAYLNSHGYSEIPVIIGDDFGEKYDAGRYERKRIRSPRPAGTIVTVVQRGFIDRKGVTIQKAIVAVSGGA